MMQLDELINKEDPGLVLVEEWIAGAVRPVEVLPPSSQRDEALLKTQVTTRSPMGAIVHGTDGILVDHGWLQILGSGHDRLKRTLPGWNEGRSDGFWLVADDAVGGIFAINGGAIGAEPNTIFYLAPDTLRWEPMEGNCSQFLVWAFSDQLDTFYEWIRWPNWQNDVATLHGDRCYTFYPPLFTTQGKGGIGRRGEIPVEESWGLQLEMQAQLGGPST
jgi:hypothetical protein